MAPYLCGGYGLIYVYMCCIYISDCLLMRLTELRCRGLSCGANVVGTGLLATDIVLEHSNM